jgi:hypothetical protein
LALESVEELQFSHHSRPSSYLEEPTARIDGRGRLDIVLESINKIKATVWLSHKLFAVFAPLACKAAGAPTIRMCQSVKRHNQRSRHCKVVFSVPRHRAEGAALIRRQLTPRYVLAFFQKLPFLIGIEACATSHRCERQFGERPKPRMKRNGEPRG